MHYVSRTPRVSGTSFARRSRFCWAGGPSKISSTSSIRETRADVQFMRRRDTFVGYTLRVESPARTLSVLASWRETSGYKPIPQSTIEKGSLWRWREVSSDRWVLGDDERRMTLILGFLRCLQSVIT